MNLSNRICVDPEIPAQGYNASPSSDVRGYCLYRSNGEMLVLIESKRTRREAKAGEEQVLQYVTEIAKKQSFCPFAIMTNGEKVFFRNSEDRLSGKLLRTSPVTTLSG